MKILTSLSQKILPILFWLLLMLAFDTPAMTVMTVLAAVLHEMGHIAAALAVGCGDVSLPYAALTGLRILPPQLMSYKNEIIIALGGPIANLAVFVILIPFLKSDYIFAFTIINLLTAASNLLPVGGYDGYRAVRGILITRMSPDAAEIIMCAVSLSFSSVAVFISLFLMMRVGEGYWIFAIFFAVLLKEAFKMQKRAKSKN